VERRVVEDTWQVMRLLVKVLMRWDVLMVKVKGQVLLEVLVMVKVFVLEVVKEVFVVLLFSLSSTPPQPTMPHTRPAARVCAWGAKGPASRLCSRHPAGAALGVRPISLYSGRDCVQSHRPSYTGFYPVQTDPSRRERLEACGYTAAQLARTHLGRPGGDTAHPWSHFPLRRAHPGPDSNTHLLPPSRSSVDPTPKVED
jgi:hypothetical protein